MLIAEGSNGSLKYKVRPRDKRTQYCLGLVSEISDEDESIMSRLPDTIDIRFGIVKGGYGWILPHARYYSVGVVGTAQYFEHPKTVMQEFMQENGFFGEFTIHTHIIPIGGIKRTTVHSRLLLSGDAAGFVDAFTGEGMAYAIRSGQLAAEVISDLVNFNLKLSKLKEYELKCRQKFRNYLAGSLKMAKIMYGAVIDRNYKDYIRCLLLSFCLTDPISKIKSLKEEINKK